MERGEEEKERGKIGSILTSKTERKLNWAYSGLSLQCLIILYRNLSEMRGRVRGDIEGTLIFGALNQGLFIQFDRASSTSVSTSAPTRRPGLDIARARFHFVEGKRA